jgi:flagellar L-ring protein precursor FlgH
MHPQPRHHKQETRTSWIIPTIWIVLLVAASTPARARDHDKPKQDSLDRYLTTLSASEVGTPPAQTRGSLWSDQSPITTLASDAKARRLHDLITIAVAEQTLAQATGDVTSQRHYSASSGISALGGHISTSGVNQLFSPSSSTSLKGKGQSNSNSTLRTTLAGEVVAVFPNGNMVVEATRSVRMNNEQRTLVLRGLVRPADISPANVVSSAAIAHLEIDLKGKGVVSDGTRPNNFGIRWLWKVLGF